MLALMKEHIGHLLLINSKFLDVMLVFCRSSKIELLYFCVLIESLAGYAYDEKHNGRHTDGKHDDLYPHGTKHAKHDKDATFAYQIVETDRTFTYDAAGKLVSATETEDNYGTYIYTYEYDLMGNRTYMEKTLNLSLIHIWQWITI